MDIELRHEYKVFRNGEYLGLIPNVRSHFEYSQDINTGATETIIEVAQTLDTTPEEPEAIQDELGVDITDESGSVLTTETSVQLVGGKDGDTLIANGNDVEVWEFSEDNPNGVLAFDGFISRWYGIVGGKDNIQVVVTNDSKDLVDYIFGNSAFVSEVAYSANDFVYGFGRGSGSIQVKMAQTFNDASGFELSKVVVPLAVGNMFLGTEDDSADVTMAIYRGVPTGSYTLETAVVVTITNKYSVTGLLDTDFILASPVTIEPGVTYFVRLTTPGGARFTYDAPGAYASGALYSQVTPGGWNENVGADMSFELFSGSLLTDAIFSSYDPSQMIRDAIDGYRAQGGAARYTDDSIDDTGLSVDYTFIMATIDEIVAKARELAPSGWYWFVDPATQVLTFKETSTTPDHMFQLGKHITEEFAIDASIQHIKNVTYFTGGPTLGVNLLRLYTNQNSLEINRRGMQRMNDNRIVEANEAAAESIADSSMQENSTEAFSAEFEISSETYDINSVALGQTVGFNGLASFLNNVVLQIVRKTRTKTGLRLRVGMLPFRSAVNIEQISKGLNEQQTLDNPDTPG